MNNFTMNQMNQMNLFQGFWGVKKYFFLSPPFLGQKKVHPHTSGVFWAILYLIFINLFINNRSLDVSNVYR